MRTHTRSNALLVELMIVILFFMLASTVLIQVFAKARSMSASAETIAAAIMDAQNAADRLITAADPESELEEMGFSRDGGKWVLDRDSYRMEAETERIPAPAGKMIRQSVRVISADGTELLRLPCSRYEEVAA